MAKLIEIVNFLYAYCTDFVINLANITGLSYYEINAIVFCVIYPILTIGLPLLFIIQKTRFKKIKKLHIQ